MTTLMFFFMNKCMRSSGAANSDKKKHIKEEVVQED